MDKYHISIRPEALQRLDLIYSNVCYRSLDDSTAENLISAIEQAISSLETMPQRGAGITIGIFANKGYRKIMVKNHIIVYAVLEKQKEVVIIHIKSIRMDI